MTTFSTITDGGGDTPILALHEGRIYLYCATTELWHRSQNLEEQLRSEDRDGGAAEVPSAIVPTILAGLRATHRQWPGEPAVEPSLSRPPTDVRTSAELGLLTQTPAEASTAELPALPAGIRELLEELSLHERRVVARFPLPWPPGQPARHLAEAISAGVLPELMGIPLLATRALERGHEIVTVTRVEAAKRTVVGRPYGDIHQMLLRRWQVFSHIPDEELVTLAAQTCGDSLDGWDMQLSMLVLDEVERRDLLTMVIAHRAERLHRRDPHLSHGGAASKAAGQFAHWRNEFYRSGSAPHPRESFRQAAEIALLAEDRLHDWPRVRSGRRSEIVEEVLDESRRADTGELDIDSAEQLLRTRVEEYLNGPEYAAFMAEIDEILRRNDAERESDDGSA